MILPPTVFDDLDRLADKGGKRGRSIQGNLWRDSAVALHHLVDIPAWLVVGHEAKHSLVLSGLVTEPVAPYFLRRV